MTPLRQAREERDKEAKRASTLRLLCEWQFRGEKPYAAVFATESSDGRYLIGVDNRPRSKPYYEIQGWGLKRADGGIRVVIWHDGVLQEPCLQSVNLALEIEPAESPFRLMVERLEIIYHRMCRDTILVGAADSESTVKGSGPVGDSHS